MTTETAPEAITRDELADALRELNITAGSASTFYPAVADGIFGHVLRNREPEYVPGGIYESATGRRYLRVHNDAMKPGPWVLIYEDGAVQPCPANAPKRPLRRLVPEGSPLGDGEQALIHADLSRLLDLLGLGAYARPESPHEVFLMCIEQVKRFITPVDLRNREESGR